MPGRDLFQYRTVTFTFHLVSAELTQQDHFLISIWRENSKYEENDVGIVFWNQL